MLPFHQIVTYIRYVDRVRAFRKCRFYGANGWQYSLREVSMSELFAGHTSWIGEQIGAYAAKKADAQSRRAA